MSLLTRIFGAPVSTLCALELQEKLKGAEPPFVLDVRQPEEFHLGHVAGAKLIPLGELGRRLNEVPQGREIVCICATGHRSVPAGYPASHLKKWDDCMAIVEIVSRKRNG
jgi:sulfur-carrier protein adenylyltransferase/sulfurtransferase